MATLGAAGAISFFAGLPTEAQNGKGGPRRIDVHHHRTTVGGGGRGEWTPERSLDEMGKYDIDVAITSVSASGPALYDGTENGNTFARTSNEQGAKMVQQYPGRFGLFLALPMNDIQGTLKEIAYGYDTLKADGVHIYSSIGEKWPGDPMYMPIYEELNRRKAMIFFHPTPPLCCKMPPGIGAAACACEVMRPPKDLPPANRGSEGTRCEEVAFSTTAKGVRPLVKNTKAMDIEN